MKNPYAQKSKELRSNKQILLCQDCEETLATQTKDSIRLCDKCAEKY